MVKEIGYNVIAVDIELERFKKILEHFDIPAVKADLERDRIAIDDEFCDCVVFSEVLEHLSPYYVSHALTEINRITKTGGYLILTTPNVASLFRRLKLLLSRSPIYRYNVKGYTKLEVEKLLKKNGFQILRSVRAR